MGEPKQYLVVTNNLRIHEIPAKKIFKIIFVPGEVKAVLSHCLRLLQEDNMMLVADIMGGRRARAFPCLTVLLKEKTENEDNGGDWLKILDYQMLDEGRKKLYNAYDETLKEDFRILDRSLCETVIKNLGGIDGRFMAAYDTI